jgi:hypothetical protein
MSQLKQENKILAKLQTCNMFSTEPTSHVLHNIATKDLATEPIQESLLNAEKCGLKQLMRFVNKRLTTQDGVIHQITRTKHLTFCSLCEVAKENKCVVIKKQTVSPFSGLERLMMLAEQ